MDDVVQELVDSLPEGVVVTAPEALDKYRFDWTHDPRVGMPVAAVRFVREGKYDLRAALGLAIGGIPAVLLAAYVVRSLPLTWLRWLVVVIVLYAAALMLLAARSKAGAADITPAPSQNAADSSHR